ncbi:16S rRNA (cytidine(1402)-2'-O)-methyltransferase [uncultured Turicimonas sp.]|uniref:16S rRNA (cytidine(1402)-2'-O)-methyltransferase n=1 Tax=uncultured Turicimonas sp. TaxID=1918607 RepID=UPI003211C3E1
MDSVPNQFENNILFTETRLASQDFPAPALYVVGLPIGNFADITLRALWTLSLCDKVAAEDTRETSKLLQKFSLSKELFPVHQHNEQNGASKILGFLEEGLRIALVTDAGTPAISDPGCKVVDAVQKAGFPVIPIPGSSAVVTALSAAGMAPEGFIFHGFLDSGSKERLKTIKELVDMGRTFVLYEAPHRMEKLAKELAQTVPPERKIVVARELTKKFEEIKDFTSETIVEWFASKKPAGEFVVIINADISKKEQSLDENTLKWLKRLSPLLPTGELSAMAHDITGIPKKQIYDVLVQLKKQD